MNIETWLDKIPTDKVYETFKAEINKPGFCYSHHKPIQPMWMLGDIRPCVFLMGIETVTIQCSLGTLMFPWPLVRSRGKRFNHSLTPRKSRRWIYKKPVHNEEDYYEEDW